MKEAFRRELISELRAIKEARAAARGAGGNAVSNVGHPQSFSGIEAFVVGGSRIGSANSQLIGGVARRAETGSMPELKARSLALRRVIKGKTQKYADLIAEAKSQVNDISSKGFYASLEDKIWSKFSGKLLTEAENIESDMDKNRETIENYHFGVYLANDFTSERYKKLYYQDFNWSKSTFIEYIHKMDPLIHDLNVLNLARSGGMPYPHLYHLLNTKFV